MSILRKYKTFDEILPDFLVEKRMSMQHKSYLAYPGRCEIFSKWLTEHGLSKTPLKKISNAQVASFYSWVSEVRDLDRATVEKYIVAIRSLFQYAQKRGEVSDIPFGLVVLPVKKRDCSPKYIPADKQSALLQDMYKTDFQLFLACMVQYFCALRPGKELRLVKVKDFDLKEGAVHVSKMNAKTGKERYITLPDELAGYLREYGVEHADPEHFLFGKKRKIGPSHVSINNLRERFNVFRSRHGISKEVKFYSWKHTGGTDLVHMRLLSVTQLQNHFGHDRITSTEKYIEECGGKINRDLKDKFKSRLNLNKTA
jgi:integrase